MRKIIESTLASADGVVSRLAQTLLENGLIDELRLSIHPVLAGAGLPQFSNGDKTPLTLVSAKTFTTGVVVLSYQTAGA